MNWQTGRLENTKCHAKFFLNPYDDHASRTSPPTSTGVSCLQTAKRKLNSEEAESSQSFPETPRKRHKIMSIRPIMPHLPQHNRSPFTVKQQRCVNCGMSAPINGHQWTNCHGCIYHPGSLTTHNNWSCCGSSSLVRGCLVTRHTEIQLSQPRTALLDNVREQMVF